MTATWSPLVDVFEDQDGITLNVELPDTEHIRAESKDGVLRIALPKKAETKPRIKVSVSAGSTQSAPANKQ